MSDVRYGYAPTLSSWGAAAPQPSARTVTTSRRTAPSDGTQRSHLHAFLVCDRGSRVGDEYLTVSEVASLLKVSPKRVRNMMSGGTFQPGDQRKIEARARAINDEIRDRAFEYLRWFPSGNLAGRFRREQEPAVGRIVTVRGFFG